jgi:hypothetical protein
VPGEAQNAGLFTIYPRPPTVTKRKAKDFFEKAKTPKLILRSKCIYVLDTWINNLPFIILSDCVT